MLIVISPAKTLDFDTPPTTQAYTTPAFLPDSAELIAELRALSPPQISALMKISDKLGNLNFGRFLNWHTPFTPDNAKQAVLAFKGDVYTGLQADTFGDGDFAWAQQHLRILSGLYGLLKPLDLIQPYRLEMGTKFANRRGSNLYQFWGAALTEALDRDLAGQDNGVLINLASNEYFKAIRPKALRAEVITPVFKDLTGGQYKIISFYAKKARGLMSAYIVKNRLQDPEAIKHFDTAGYYYAPELSGSREWVFLRGPRSERPY